jgi:hypothetical protein
MPKPPTPNSLKVRMVANVPLDLANKLDALQRKLRKGSCWQGRSDSSISSLIIKALQEYVHAHG